MTTCELCGKQVHKGYLVVDEELDKPYVVCQKCGKAPKVDKKK